MNKPEKSRKRVNAVSLTLQQMALKNLQANINRLSLRLKLRHAARWQVIQRLIAVLAKELTLLEADPTVTARDKALLATIGRWLEQVQAREDSPSCH